MVLPVSSADLRSLLKLETTFGDRLVFIGGDAISLSEPPRVTFGRQWNRKATHTGSASNQGSNKGKYRGTLSLACEVKINAAGTAPQQGVMCELAMGSQVAGIKYDHIGTGVAVPSGQFAYSIGTSLYQQINGLVLTKLELEGEGGATTMLRAEGEFAELSGIRGSPEVLGIEAIGESTIELKSGHCKYLRGPSTTGDNAQDFLVKFGSEDNGGAGYLVTDVDYTTDILTVTPTMVNALAADDLVSVVLPTATLDGSEVDNLESQITIFGSTVEFIKSLFSVQTGFLLLDKEAGTAKPNRAVRTKDRLTTGSVSFYLLDATAEAWTEAMEGNTTAVTVRHGPNTAGSRIQAKALKALITKADSLELPGNDAATYTAEWEAEQSAAADDEAQLDFS